MNYKKIYKRIISRAKNRVCEDGVYYESHHIKPCCFFELGRKDPLANVDSNLVMLTAEEHYVCHQLLVKMHPDNYSLIRAVDCMSMFSKTTTGKSKNKKYGWVKKKLVKKRHTKVCIKCGVTFTALDCVKDKQICSRACYLKKQEKKCLVCSEVFSVGGHNKAQLKQKFCSKDCFVVYKRRTGLYNIKCKECGKEHTVTRSRKDKKFCNMDCCRAYKLKNRKAN